MQHIPYRGPALAVTDIIAGHVDMIFSDPGTVVSLVKDGKLRALAVTSKERYSVLPDVPTVSEAGLPGFEARAWHMIVAPAGTPEPVVSKLRSEFQAVLAHAGREAAVAHRRAGRRRQPRRRRSSRQWSRPTPRCGARWCNSRDWQDRSETMMRALKTLAAALAFSGLRARLRVGAAGPHRRHRRQQHLGLGRRRSRPPIRRGSRRC